MKHQIERHHRLILAAIYLASLLLPLIAPVSSTAQTELRGAWRSTVSHLPISSLESGPAIEPDDSVATPGPLEVA